DHGVSWDSSNGRALGDEGISRVVSSRTGKLYIVTKSSHLYSSINLGTSWEPMLGPETHYPLRYAKATGSGLLLSDMRGLLYQTTNKGLKWDTIFSARPVQSFAESRVDGSLFLFTLYGELFKSTGGPFARLDSLW